MRESGIGCRVPRECGNAPPPTATTKNPESLAEALGAAMAPILRDLVAAEVARALAGRGPDELVPHTAWPLGSRRRCAQLARAGAIPNAVRRGKLWLARRSDVERYAAAGEPPAPKVQQPPADEIDAILARARGAR